MGIKWSYSRISTYIKCPYKYYLKYIRKKYLYTPNNNFVIGNAFGEFVEAWSKDSHLSLREALRIYFKVCLKHKYRDDVEELKYLSYLVKQFYEQDKRIEPLYVDGVAAVEYKIAFKLIDELFDGAIDIIDEHGGVLDYKTSNKLYTLDDLKPTSDKGLQLYIYALGYLRKFKKMPPYVGFVVVVKDNPIYVQKLTRPVTKADLIKAKNYLEKILLEIFKTKKWKKNICGLCDYCDYLDTYCEGRPVEERQYHRKKG